MRPEFEYVRTRCDGTMQMGERRGSIAVWLRYGNSILRYYCTVALQGTCRGPWVRRRWRRPPVRDELGESKAATSV